MTIIKTNKIKEIFENIKQEQKVLNNLERLEDWEERFIEQSEELEEIEKDLESKTKEAERNERAFKLYIENTLKKEKEMEQRIEALEKKDESKQISLLKETHQKEIKELNDRLQYERFIHSHAIEDIIKKNEEVKELEKEMEEKELLVESLRVELKEAEKGREANLDAIGVGIKFEVEKILGEIEKLKEELNSERETGKDLVQRLAGMVVENKKMVESWNEKHREVKEETRKNLKKDEIIKELKEELYFANKPLPSLPEIQTPSKFKTFREKAKTKFQNLIEKVKHQSHELVAKIEVKTK